MFCDNIVLDIGVCQGGGSWATSWINNCEKNIKMYENFYKEQKEQFYVEGITLQVVECIIFF